jgi:hypothetical protein
MAFLLGVAVLILLLWGASSFSKADPKQAARLVRAVGGVAALIFAAFLLFRGEVVVALGFGTFGLGLLGWTFALPASIRGLFAAQSDGGQSRWGENPQGDAAAGGRARSTASGKMTEEEAYQILGVQPGASADAISRAHRALIKKLHPDQGGSTYLAARINEAKDVLLRRHR